MTKVDRKLFVPDSKLAYNDAPQVIGEARSLLLATLQGFKQGLLCALF